MASDSQFEFGPFLFDFRQRRLFRAHVPVHLTRNQLKVLECVLQSRQKLVTDDELIQAIWGNEDIAKDKTDGKTSYDVRKTAGFLQTLEHQGHTFIRRVPQLGYRFEDPNQKVVQVSHESMTRAIDAPREIPLVNADASRNGSLYLPNINRHIYCADMMQLIAGDAYLSGLTKGCTEPMAESAFEYLTTILCNDTLVYFKKPKILRLRTPIIRAWHESSREWKRNSMVTPRASTPSSDLHVTMSEDFARWLKDERYREITGYTKIELLAEWTKYQLGDKNLLDQYWSNNTATDMMDALDAFRTVQGLAKPRSSGGDIESVLSTNAVVPDKISCTRWGKRPLRDFYIAWVYWSYAKGYQYILQIPDGGAYVCHWIREDSCTKGVTYETASGKRNLLKGLFPWGFLLGEIIRYFGFHRSEDETYAVIMELRRYTKENFYHLSPFEVPTEDTIDALRQKTVEFVQGAMARIAPSRWERLLRDKRLENIALVPYVLKRIQLETSFSEMRTGLDLVLPPVRDLPGETRKTSVAEALVRLSRYREPARAFVARHENTFRRFWQERGWV